ncbi:MAG: hypothetical protein QM528_04030 [Phycisphaerales bacterium]|nr:hypothetical protein [Phycisphaerales bacterium]
MKKILCLVLALFVVGFVFASGPVPGDSTAHCCKDKKSCCKDGAKCEKSKHHHDKKDEVIKASELTPSTPVQGAPANNN